MDTEDKNPRAVMGGNEPPDDVWKETNPLRLEALERIEAGNKWITERPEITDADMADKLSAFIGQITTTFNALDRERKDDKAAAVAEIDNKFNEFLKPLATAKEILTGRRNAWLKKEESRLAAEKAKADAEAKRLADEAAAAIKRAEEEASKKGGDPLRAAQAAQDLADRAAEAEKQAEAAPVKAQIKGSYTTTAVGLKDRWGAEITDLSEAFKHYNKRAHPAKPILEAAIRECILVIAKRESVALKNIDLAPPGIKFTKERV